MIIIIIFNRPRTQRPVLVKSQAERQTKQTHTHKQKLSNVYHLDDKNLIGATLIARGVTVDGVWIGRTGFIDHSKLQVNTPLLLISTFYKSPQHPQSLFPACCVNSRSVATASNRGNSSASRAHIVTLRQISHNRNLAAGLGSSLYSLGADPTENIASKSFHIVVVVSFLATTQVSLTSRSSVTKQRMFLLAIVA
jgi:hypothetical protein